MNHNFAPARVFRVTGARVVDATLVIEYVERREFKDAGGSTGVDERFLEEGSGTASADRYTFHALDVLRYHRLYGDAAEPQQVARRSIDEAVDQAENQAEQAEARRRELIEFAERWRRGHLIDELGDKKLAAAPTEPRSDVGKGSGPELILQYSEASPEEWRRMEEQMKQHIKEVWGYGRGKRLEWKRVGRTPAGRDCEMLTVDGAER